MIDFEDRLKDLLNQRVDEQVGPQRAPAPFAPGAPSGRRRTRWLAPTIAAACVAAVAGGTIGVTRLLANGHHPAGNASSSVAPSPIVSTPTPYQPSTTPVPHPAPATHIVHALGATLVLPDGWTITGYEHRSDGLGPAICIGKAGDSALRCPIWLSALRPGETSPTYGFDVDGVNLNRGDLPASMCDRGQTRSTWLTGERTLGGRSAEWRALTFTCPATGKIVRFDQYTVITTPGFLLQLTAGIKEPYMTQLGGVEVANTKAMAALRSIVDGIANDSALPAQDAPLRLFDRGIIHSIHRSNGTVMIQLERVVPEFQGRHVTYRDENPGAFTTYVMSPNVFAPGQSMSVGDRINVLTNGTTVTYVEKDA